MGADLYIRSLNDKTKKKYEALFNDAVEKRDNAKTEKERDKHQREVIKYYDLMYSKGYFRDSYNNSNLLWQFNLDYWTYFAGFLNKQSRLTPTKAKKLLAELEEKEAYFETHLCNQKKIGKNILETSMKSLRNFLKQPFNQKNPLIVQSNLASQLVGWVLPLACWYL